MASIEQFGFAVPVLIDADAIIEGTQPARLTRGRLLESELPLDWSEQEGLFGFTA